MSQDKIWPADFLALLAKVTNKRAKIEGGRLEVRSVVGEGTEVRASFADPD